jgi:archaellum component FlaD/FlaE
MNMTSIKSTAAKSYAHLLGLRSIKSKKAQDDYEEEVKKAEEEEEEKEKKAEKEEEKEENKKTGKKAEEKDGDGEEEKDKGKKASKKSAEETEEEDEDEDEDEEKRERAEITGNTAFARCRHRERERCSAIFGSKAAAGRPHIAARFAFHTSMTAKEAISVMEGLADDSKPSGATLSERMRDVKNPRITPDADNVQDAPSSNSVANRILKNAAKIIG